MNLCRTCGADFASVKAFDAHRVGKHAYTYDEGLLLEPPREDGRRCLAVSEMVAMGWVRNRSGRWVHPQALRNRPKKGSYSLTEAADGPTPALRMSRTSEGRSDRITAAGSRP
jgi:hypothetical protein